jgi:hypothetical protein
MPWTQLLLQQLMRQTALLMAKAMMVTQAWGALDSLEYPLQELAPPLL